MEDAGGLRCWCYGCSRVVSPIREIEPLKCPFCEGGFVEEMETAVGSEGSSGGEITFDSEHAALSLWAPILLGMMRSSLRQRNTHSTTTATTTTSSSNRLRHVELDGDHEEEEEEDVGNNSTSEHTELYRELDSIIRRRRRRSSATILQLIQGIQAGMTDETLGGRDDENDETERERRGRLILINPFSQSIVVHGSNDSNPGNPTPHVGSLGDYFFGPGLDVLLHQLAENDPNRYGTPPAQKKAVEAMPVVRVEDSLQCCVCLDDIEVGSEAKEMPCKHKFHCGCILPWLELHSSCPVCRHQLPCDDNSSNEPRANDVDNVSEGAGHNRGGSPGRQFSVQIPWPFGNLFSPSTSTNSTGSRSHTQED